MITKKCKKTVLLPAGIGDWTKYKPHISEFSKIKLSKPQNKSQEKELLNTALFFINFSEKFLHTLQKSISFPSITTLSCSLEVNTYDEILKSIDIPVAQFRLLNEKIDPFFLCFDMNLANAIINSSLGATYDLFISKVLTEIEENVLEIVLNNSASVLVEGNTGKTEIKYMNSPNVYFDQSINETDLLVLVTVHVSLGRITGKFFMIFNLSDLSKIYVPHTKSANFEPNKLPVSITNKIVMPVVSFLGSTVITAKDLHELEEGDVIVLDTSINSLLPILIGEDLHITGQPAIKDDRLCVQILRSGFSKIDKIRVKRSNTERDKDNDVSKSFNVSEQSFEEKNDEDFFNQENFDMIDDNNIENLAENIEGIDNNEAVSQFPNEEV